MSYKPKFPFNVPAELLVAETTFNKGTTKKQYTSVGQIFVSAKSYGGTERVINDKYVIEDTMVMETWYNPTIESDSRIRLLDDGSEWEVINSPEDIDRMHRYLRFKVKRLKGGA